MCRTKEDLKSCKFPFRYAGKTFQKCTSHVRLWIDGDPWCPVISISGDFRNDYPKFGSSSAGDGVWGYCNCTFKKCCP